MSVGLLLGCALLASMAALALAWPALRRPPERPRVGFDLAVYRDQLAEIERDRTRGLIGGAEAAAAKLEVERRILRAAAASSTEEGAGGRRWPALAAALAVPLLVTGLYLGLGTPALEDQPLASRELPTPGPDVAAMVGRLEERLAREPQDPRGWLMLGRSRMVMGQPDAAIAAYRRALELAPDEPEAIGGLAESLIVGAGGTIAPEALALLTRLDDIVPGQPRIGYYLGLAAAQSGDVGAAVERWRLLLAAAPADAPWRAGMVEAIRGAAARLGIEVETMLAATPGVAPQPGAAGAAAIAALPPEQRQDRIREMVDGLQARLEADGGDVEGWSRLAQARGVLGEREAALSAWDRALALAPEDPALLKGKAGVLLGPEVAEGAPEVGDAAAALYEKAAAIRPDDAEALWFLGLRDWQQGRPAEARQRWDRMLAQLDPGRAETIELRALIERFLAPG
ncbi:MAG TPA: c-type cytochrome biogenesis protein CcmI [Geminicoccaceae bacterium]|nr:c-type cytochrome biogenesis protein CcmI [Geminicoccus sp.]HMU48732.1 c-type cytochrome biogenesis protein CcmI [Geminicoccaceae bacterium]